jgi:2'-5' RNA ligase
MKRIFVAVRVEPGSELKRMISSLKSLLASERIKWVDLINIHLTLVFLGDTEEKRLTELSGLLKEKCNGFPVFEFLLSGTGVFKNFRDPRVIWAGIKNSGELNELQSLISAGLKSAGFIFEERQFNPHLTIARIKSVSDNEKLKKVLGNYAGTDFQKVQVKEVILFESILRQEGPIYKQLEKYLLIC